MHQFQKGARKESKMKQRYSLYELIKDRLSPNTRKKLESQMQYREIVRQAHIEEYIKDNEEGEQYDA